MRHLLLVTLAASLVACSDSAAPLTNDLFAPGLGVDLAAMTRTSSGLYYQDLVVGPGSAVERGANVMVHYDGWLADGTLFDSSRDRTPFIFVVGEGRVIRGWDEGVVGIRVGGTRRLVIPPELAYGETGQGPIPPNAVLVFDVELLGLQRP